jgi:predicted transposase YbfD/YdcC
MSFKVAMASGFRETSHDSVKEVDKGHGRVEIRESWVIGDDEVMHWINSQYDWPGLRAIGMVRSERRIGAKVEQEDRYYLLSKTPSAVEFAQAVRSHWGIENRVHWVLDMAFHEDASRIRQGYAAENFAVLRHIALNLLQRHPTKRRSSIRTRRLKAGWDRTYWDRTYWDRTYLMELLTDN